MKATLFAFFITLAIFLTPEIGRCAGRDTKIVTRIDTVTAAMKGGTLTVHVEGMASTPSLLGRTGQLVKRGQGPNKDGLLEYELVFNPPQKNYTGDALKPIKVTLKVPSIPVGVKGVRIYAEYNELDGILPESTQKLASKKNETFWKPDEPVVAKKEKPVAKKEEVAAKKEEPAKTSQSWNPFHHKPATVQVNAPPPAAKKPEVALKKKAPVVKKEEPIVAKKEKPALKQEEPKKPEVVLKKEEKTKRGWNWNPFHHKPAATTQVNAPTPTKKEAPVLKKKEPVVKKEELVVTKKEKPVAKNEEVAPKIEKKKSHGWNLNPFHRKPVASQTEAMPPEPKKPELELKKKKPVVRTEESFATKKENPIPKKEEAALLKKEEAAPKKEKKSRSWNLNPFHRKSTASQVDATPPAPKKEEPAPKKKELVVTKEKPALKKEEAAPPKKEEKKKKDHWYWNPFHRKSDAQNSDESPR